MTTLLLRQIFCLRQLALVLAPARATAFALSRWRAERALRGPRCCFQAANAQPHCHPSFCMGKLLASAETEYSIGKHRSRDLSRVPALPSLRNGLLQRIHLLLPDLRDLVQLCLQGLDRVAHSGQMCNIFRACRRRIRHVADLPSEVGLLLRSISAMADGSKPILIAVHRAMYVHAIK